jgi:hypothetical protein
MLMPLLRIELLLLQMQWLPLQIGFKLDLMLMLPLQIGFRLAFMLMLQQQIESLQVLTE